MSHSTLLIVRQDGTVARHARYQNGHGSGPVVWTTLAEKYRSLLYPNDVPGEKYYRGFDEWDELFKKSSELPLTWWEHNVLNWTNDYSIVRREDFDICIRSLREFVVDPKRVSHLKAVADDIEKLGASAEPILGVCFQCTSISDNLWVVSLPEDAEEEERPYDINLDTEHHYVEFRAAV